jgi:hypothetical protein
MLPNGFTRPSLLDLPIGSKTRLLSLKSCLVGIAQNSVYVKQPARTYERCGNGSLRNFGLAYDPDFSIVSATAVAS